MTAKPYARPACALTTGLRKLTIQAINKADMRRSRCTRSLVVLGVHSPSAYDPCIYTLQVNQVGYLHTIALVKNDAIAAQPVN